MADEPEFLSVKNVFGAAYIKGLEHNPNDERRRRRQSQERPARPVKDYFRTMVKAAEASNAVLTKRKSPYRFCVYMKDDQVFIDFVVLDEKGKVREVQKRNITEEDFVKLIDDMSKNEGLLLDTTG